MVKKRKGVKGKPKKLGQAKNVARGAFSIPNEGLQQIGRTGGRHHSPPDLIFGRIGDLEKAQADEFIAWLHTMGSQSLRLFPKLPIEDPEELALSEVATVIPLPDRLYWLAVYLQRFHEDIAAFLVTAREFEAALLVGDSVKAFHALDAIEERFGYSLWYFDNKIAALQRFRGLEAQKEFAREIGKKARGKLAGVYSFYASERNEDGTVLNRFRNRLEQRIATWRVKDPLKNAYGFLLSIRAWDEISWEAASAIVGSVSSVSLVDAYNILLSALEYLSYYPLNSADRPRILSILSVLPTADTRSSKLAFILGAPSERACTITARDGLDANDILMRSFSAAPRADVTGASLSGELEQFARASIFRPEGFGRESDSAAKTFANLAHLPTVRAVSSFIRFQGQYEVLAGPSVGTPLVVNSRGDSPLHNLVLPNDHTVSDRSGVAALGPPSANVFSAEVTMRFALRDGDAKAALVAYDQAANESLTLRRLSPLRTRALLGQMDYEQALGAIADACCEDSDLVPLLPMEAMMDVARSRQFKFTDKISMAVFLDHFIRRAPSSDLLQALQFAYEDAVLSYGEQLPSRLPDHDESQRRAKVVYFLRYIAVPSVMDVSFWLFKTSRATQEERLNVCARLIELDPNHAGDYQSEIQEITRALSIEDGLEHVDRSRIFIGVRKLHQWAEQEIEEGFDRYKALVRAGVGFSDSGEFEKIMKDIAAGTAPPEGLMQYPTDEAAQLLIDLFTSIQQEYLHNADFGLDAYLSMRVRHGSLAGHLRGPFEEAGLLANRDRGTGRYQPSAPTNSLALRADAHHERAALDDAIRTFSAAFDALIDELVKQRLQIHRADRPQGMFAFDRTSFIIFFLKANIDEATTLGEFVSLCVTVLDVFLTRSLQNVRDFITDEFAEAARATIDGFKNDADHRLSISTSSEISSRLLGAVADWQASLARVASWFAPGKEQETRSFRTMAQIVEIALQATKNAHRNFDPELTTEIADLGLQSSEVLMDMTDVLFTILDNVHAHSGLGDRPKVNIKVSAATLEQRAGATDVLKRVRIRVANAIDRRAANTNSERKVRKIREQIQNGQYRSHVKLEGGTGLLKLQRIVAQDNRQALEFGFVDDEFYVQVDLVVLYRLDGAAAP